MKPEGFQEFATPLDICEAGIEDAKEMINAQIGQNVSSKSIVKGEHFGYYIVKVPSQDLSVAFCIQKQGNVGDFMVDLSLDYQPDEWSVEFVWYDTETLVRKVFGIWSPGACG